MNTRSSIISPIAFTREVRSEFFTNQSNQPSSSFEEQVIETTKQRFRMRQAENLQNPFRRSVLNHAVLEAEAMAVQSGFAELIFPELLEEHASKALIYADRQEEIWKITQTLYSQAA
jgi:hypothetical protein